MNETETRTWSSDEVKELTGATFRQIDHWCSGGVFGDQHQKPGSGTRRRFAIHEVFEATVLMRLSDALCKMSASRTAGSVVLYANVVNALRGKRIESFTVTYTEISFFPTEHSEQYIAIGDLRKRFNVGLKYGETLNAT